MDPDQPAHLRSHIRIHAVHVQMLQQVEKLIENGMDPDQTARMRRLVWIDAGRKRTMLILSWCGSYNICVVGIPVSHWSILGATTTTTCTEAVGSDHLGGGKCGVT
jgi:hypothetical protein